MDLPDVIEYFLAKQGAGESMPFGPEVLVYKVAGKIFAIASPDDVPARINLKCDPERAIELRERYEAIIPGFHMNKKHWNTIVLDGTVPAPLLRELIDHSYALVAPKKKKT